MGRLLRRVRYWLLSRGEDAALREELEFHHAMTQQQLEQDGMEAHAARLAARRDLGNATLAREKARAVWIWPHDLARLRAEHEAQTDFLRPL
jgi:hypothetical protein